VEPFIVARRIARGTEHWVDVAAHAGVEAAIGELRNAGYLLVQSAPDGNLVPDDLANIPRLALIFGNEHDGICQALARAADSSVRIPMRGYVESLNVSVSAAILIHAATRHRPGDLSDSEKRLLYARGLFRTVPRAAEILAAAVAKGSATNRGLKNE
jgi:tRNA (guanosine-2'-O-)-methyltransferase